MVARLHSFLISANGSRLYLGWDYENETLN